MGNLPATAHSTQDKPTTQTMAPKVLHHPSISVTCHQASLVHTGLRALALAGSTSDTGILLPLLP